MTVTPEFPAPIYAPLEHLLVNLSLEGRLHDEYGSPVADPWESNH